MPQPLLSFFPTQAEVPHIAVGTPGRILDLATKRKVLDLSKVPTCPTAVHALSSALDEGTLRTRVLTAMCSYDMQSTWLVMY